MDLSDRGKARESGFAHDQETTFRITERRNKLFGLWAAAKLGKPAGEHEAYAKQVVLANFKEASDANVLRAVKADLEAAGIRLTDHELGEQLYKCGLEAKKQII